MSTALSHSPRALLPGIVLALAVAYLFQVSPHGHSAAVHAEPHAAHQAHANHAHEHHEGAADQGAPGEQHHHHALAQHLDFHAARATPRLIDRDHGLPAVPAAAAEPVRVAPLCAYASAEPDAVEPDDPLLPHAPSRAPPA